MLKSTGKTHTKFSGFKAEMEVGRGGGGEKDLGRGGWGDGGGEGGEGGEKEVGRGGG